jgi:hypothetical protein
MLFGIFSAYFDTVSPKNLMTWGDDSVMHEYIFITNIVNALKLAATYEGKPRFLILVSGRNIA